MKIKTFRIIQSLFLIATVFLCVSNNNMKKNHINNNNLSKTVNLSTMAMKISEFNYDELYSAKDTYTGDLTGYIYNCPLCNGTLACMSNYYIKDGTTTFNDVDYGTVRIVASSANLPCGSIVRFNSPRISSDSVYAIVLDRGVLGNALDLLSNNIDAAYEVGRSSITYDVLRTGW